MKTHLFNYIIINEKKTLKYFYKLDFINMINRVIFWVFFYSQYLTVLTKICFIIVKKIDFLTFLIQVLNIFLLFSYYNDSSLDSIFSLEFRRNLFDFLGESIIFLLIYFFAADL